MLFGFCSNLLKCHLPGCYSTWRDQAVSVSHSKGLLRNREDLCQTQRKYWLKPEAELVLPSVFLICLNDPHKEASCRLLTFALTCKWRAGSKKNQRDVRCAVKLGHCTANGILCENIKKMVGKNMKYMKLMRTAHKTMPLEQQLPGLPKELNIWDISF